MRLLSFLISLLVAACSGDDERACVPGASVACVGPGGCDGGQMCLPDGAGFSDCDCGGSLDASVDAGEQDSGAIPDSGDGDAAEALDGSTDAWDAWDAWDADTTETDAGAVGVCPDGSELRRVPERPMTPDDGDAQIVMGLRDILLRQSGDTWRSVGLDLDGLCTHSVDADVECQPRGAVSVQLDGDNGIDNAFHSVFAVLDLVFPSLASSAGPTAVAGVGAFVLQVDGWNGTATDSRVQVTVSQSVAGTDGSATDDAAPMAQFVDHTPFVPGTTTPLPPPSWDGHDWFWLRDDTFLMSDLTRPRVRDDNAYIVDGELVIRVPERADLVVWGDSNGLRLQLTDARIVGRFSDDFTQLSHVTLAGRWNVLDALESVGATGICEGDTEYGILLRKLDETADVRSLPGSGGPGVSCDAVSVGLTLRGYRARIAGLERGRTLASACD